jgi:methyl-accepting chemotaxis protein
MTASRTESGDSRRQLVVDSRYQLRGGLLVGVIALILLILLNATMVLPQRATNGSHAQAASQNGAAWALVLLGSAVLIGGVALIGVLESHRTAGAAYAIRRAVDAIAEGRRDVRVRLRRGDHLQQLAASINRLAEAIDLERTQGR